MASTFINLPVTTAAIIGSVEIVQPVAVTGPLTDAELRAAPVTVAEQDLALVSDSTSTSNVTYIGYAAVGSLTSAAVWKIVRYTIISGNVTSANADGNSNFDNIWDNRTGLSYS